MKTVSMKRKPRASKNLNLSAHEDEDSTRKAHPILSVYFGYCLKKAAQKLRSDLNSALKERAGLIVPQYGILIILNELGPSSQIQLGEALGIDKATMVKLLDGLEQRGYVERVTSAQDRRVKSVQLTKSGTKMRALLREISKEIENRFLSPLNASEAKQIRAILPKLVTE
jgi:DNA-binding MarR family transcriptional regulator